MEINKPISEDKLDEVMTILANLLIDRFLDDMKNNRLKSSNETTTIELEPSK